MSTRDLIDAIQSGDSVTIQQTFESEMMSRIAERLDAKRIDVAKNMFNTEAVDGKPAKPAKVGDNHIHVSDAGNGKYKVHAVGKNFADGIKAGEHLSDSELDDFSDMGGKIKHMKESVSIDEATVGANHLHVKPVQKDGKTMYHVHAVGKNFADGIKAGEHLSDSELDDASEMGAKIKHVK